MVIVVAAIAILIAIVVPNLLKTLKLTHIEADISNAKILSYCFFEWQEEAGKNLSEFKSLSSRWKKDR